MLRVGEKIKKRREELGLTQDELAEITGYKDRSSINKIEKGGNELPQSKIVAFAKALKTTPSYLMGWEDADKEFKPTVKEIQGMHKYRSLDEHGKSVVEYILEEEYTRCEAAKATETAAEKTIKIRHSFYKVSAGRGFELGDADEWDDIDVPDTPEARKADFALTIDGDSMEPIYFNRDIVLVKQQATVEIGEVGIFVLNGSGYIKKNGGDRLISLNEKYDDIVLSEFDECRCFGKVVGRA